MDIYKLIDELPKAPDDVEEWILKEVVNKTYIIYDSKTKEAYCTKCKSKFTIYDLHEVANHNYDTSCPKCGEHATYKSRGIGRKNLEEQTRVLTFARKGKSIYGVLTEVDISFESLLPQIYTWMSAIYKFNSKEQIYIKHYPGWCFGSECWTTKKNVKLPSVPIPGFGAEPKRKGTHVYTKNFEKIFPKSDYKYLNVPSIMEEHALSAEELINYLNLSMKYKSIELLYKSGFQHLVIGKIQNYVQHSAAVYWRGQDLRKILRMDFGEIKEFRDKDITLRELSIYQEYRKKGHRLNINELEIVTHSYRSTIEAIEDISKVSHIKVAKYLAKQNFKDDKRIHSNSLTDYKDYIEDCIKAGLDIRKNAVLFPKDFYIEHMRVNDLAENNVNKKTNNAIKKFIKSFFGGKETYQNDKFLIRPALKSIEFYEESSKLGHCVKSYAKRVANKTTIIMFIRKLEDLETSYYTLELSPETYEIVQCRGKSNCSTTQEINEFINEWHKNIVVKIEKQNKAKKSDKKIKQKKDKAVA